MRPSSSIASYLCSFVEESNADKAIKALTAALAPKARVKRDGKVSTVEAKELVPGDIIVIQFGNIVPADIKLLGKENDNTETPMQVKPVPMVTLNHQMFSSNAVKGLDPRTEHSPSLSARPNNACLPLLFAKFFVLSETALLSYNRLP